MQGAKCKRRPASVGGAQSAAERPFLATLPIVLVQLAGAKWSPLASCRPVQIVASLQPSWPHTSPPSHQARARPPATLFDFLSCRKRARLRPPGGLLFVPVEQTRPPQWRQASPAAALAGCRPPPRRPTRRAAEPPGQWGVGARRAVRLASLPAGLPSGRITLQPQLASTWPPAASQTSSLAPLHSPIGGLHWPLCARGSPTVLLGAHFLLCGQLSSPGN